MDLRGNQITDAGADSLAGALEANTSLQALSLGDNKIRDAGAEALAGALEANTSLQKLDLGENQITVHAQNALLEAQGKHRERSKLFLYLGEGSENGLVENEFQ